MTGEPLLDWAVMAVSLFNTITLLWLGFTVLLSAERRTWGIWLAGGGLLAGALFFVSHTIILGYSLYYVGFGMNFWWHVGWVPVVILPLGWYVVMLWYTGYWDRPDTALHRRHRPRLAVAALMMAGLVGLLLFANPLPSYTQVARLNLAASPSIGGIPLLILVYPLYIVLCIGLALDAVRRPGPTDRVMGELARGRARPWLVAASAVLLVVSVLVALVMAWLVVSASRGAYLSLSTTMAASVAWADLLIAGLIGAAVALLGQAVVSYEIFTGKTLPRGGFVRHWNRALILAAGFSAVISFSLVLNLRPNYLAVLAATLIAAFYALFAWRSYSEREHAIESLRPFVTSQRLYEHLLTPSASAPPELDVLTPFHALCRDVLGTRQAYLVALGPLAPLFGPGLAYPPGAAPDLPALAELTGQVNSPQALWAPVDPARAGGARWAVPLWSERGLVGVLLLGDKSDGGMYTQEEIEIARASGERLIDAQGSAEMARRLMALQRERLAESQVLDRRARRVLHDDVLPRLHAALLSLGEGAPPETVEQIAAVHRQISDLLHELPAGLTPEVAQLGLFGALRQLADEELAGAFDGVEWQIAPEAEAAAQALPPLAAEVLFYAAREAMRNAARHGRDPGAERPLHLRVGAAQDAGLRLTVEDDGVGLTAAAPAAGGSGQGLALHSTLLAVVGGTLAVESASGQYTRVVMALPAAG